MKTKAPRILVKGAFNAFSGYGTDLIGMTRTLVRMGCDVLIEPSNAQPPLPGYVAELFMKPLEPPFDLVLQHADPGQLEITQGARRASPLTVGWTMWESSTLDNLNSVRSMRKRLKNFDVLLGYDQVTNGAFAPYTAENKRQKYPAVAQGILQGGYFPEDWPEQERDWYSDRFGFCMVGQLHFRKDPWVAIQAFQELKEEYPVEFEPAELHLKSSQLNFHPSMEQAIPKLRIHYAVWPQDILLKFYAAQHCLLAPSKGEGKNLPCLEMMSTGGAVIATNWGGHTQWLSNEYAYPLDYKLMPVDTDPKHVNCMQACADKDHLKELMLHVFRNRADAQKKGAVASNIIPQMCSWDNVMERFFVKLAELKPDPGQQLLDRVLQLEPRQI